MIVLETMAAISLFVIIPVWVISKIWKAVPTAKHITAARRGGQPGAPVSHGPRTPRRGDEATAFRAAHVPGSPEYRATHQPDA